MWRTPRGNQVLRRAEWALFREGLSALWDQVEDAIALDGPGLVQTGLGAFDGLEPTQQLALLAQVGRAMHDQAVAAPALTAHTEAAVAAVYQQIVVDLSIEIDCSDGPEWTGEATALRSLVLTACRELTEEQDRETGTSEDIDLESDPPWVVRERPTADCAEHETWKAIVLECLSERVLWGDGDYEMGEAFLDDDPAESRSRKALMRIDADYFSAVPPDPRDSELGPIRQVLRELCERS